MSLKVLPVTKDTAIEMWNESNPDDKLENDYRTGGKFDTWYNLSNWLIRRDEKTGEVVAISAYELEDGYMKTGALQSKVSGSGKAFLDWRRKRHKGIPQVAGFRHQNPEQQESYLESRSNLGYDMNPTEEWPEIPDEVKTKFNQEYGDAWGVKKKLTWWNVLQTW